MDSSIDAYINETKRDVLVEFYLRRIASGITTRKIETPDDLYEYLLIDPEITSAVQTSPVASAIASLQTYVTDLNLGIEPNVTLTADEVKLWEQVYQQYPLWAANQLLSIYPEDYIDPTLRLSKTHLFKNLENALSQDTLSEENVRKAVFNYLNEFEKVSNLKVVNAYQSGDDISTATIYFVGRTRIQPYQYYWRKLDLQQHDPANPGLIYPTAWSEWKLIDLPISYAVRDIVRPVVFKDRLFVVWLEIHNQKQDTDIPTPLTLKKDEEAINRLYLRFGFKRFDDSWSPIQEHKLLDADPAITADKLTDLLVTVAQTDVEAAAYSILIGIYANKNLFFSLDELLTLGKDSKDVFKNYSYPFKNDANNYKAVAKPITTFKHQVASITLKSQDLSPATRVILDMDPRSKLFTVSAQIVVVSQMETLRVSIAHSPLNGPKGDRHPFILKSITINDKPVPPSSEDKVTVLDVPMPSISGGSFTLTLKATASDVAGDVVSGLSGLGTGTQIYVIKVVEVPGNYVDSSAYFQETKEGVQQFYRKNGDPAPIRLNTLFAKELIRLANIGIDELLHIFNQQDSNAQKELADLDFRGANGLYFWELFFHMPFLVGYLLNQERRFELAKHWYKYLFNPSQGAGLCWQSKAILPANDTNTEIGSRLIEPTDPDSIASAHPVHYRKAVFLYYIKNLIDEGDAFYRELTPDSLTEANCYYREALDLLGPRPQTSGNCYWKPITLENAATQTNTVLRGYEDKNKVGDVALTEGSNPYANAVVHDPTINILSTGLFYKPINKQLIAYWDILDSRIYNLRHNLSIDGKALHLPLFAPPLNPRQLLQQRNAGQGLNTILVNEGIRVPYYRFSTVINKAQTAVDSLMMFGSNLLSLLERKDARQWEKMQYEQQKALLDFTIDLQDDTISLLKANQKAWTVSQTAAKARYDYYNDLYKAGINSLEESAFRLQASASASCYLAVVPTIAAGVSKLLPNIFGVADGGQRLEGPSESLAGSFLNTAFALNMTADALHTKAMYKRRQDDWKLQRDLADYDQQQIVQQIDMSNKQLSAAQHQMDQIKKQQAQFQDNLNYFATRFTSQDLYQWMIGQLSATYFQAYDAVTSLCRFAESAWQYELGDFSTRFILPGAWNDLYHGLLAGETLKLYLQRMEQQYINLNKRKLEIVKTVSLKQHLGESPFNDAKRAGKFTFHFDQQDFDLDYPGHYLRQLATVSVYLPAVLGPYQDVKAILTQEKNYVVTSADAKVLADKLWKGTYVDPSVAHDLLGNQQIALSSGVDDNGLFVLNFGDERYLPFEGTGAISTWTLEFPVPDSKQQQTLLTSLTDVIIRLRYTAKESGNADFKKAVTDLVKQAAGKSIKK